MKRSDLNAELAEIELGSYHSHIRDLFGGVFIFLLFLRVCGVIVINELARCCCVVCFVFVAAAVLWCVIVVVVVF